MQHLAKAAAKSVKSEMFVESIPELEPTVAMYYDDVMNSNSMQRW